MTLPHLETGEMDGRARARRDDNATMRSLDFGDASQIPESAPERAGADSGIGRKVGALQMLRFGGAVTLLVATGSFLFRDWELLHSVPFYVQLLVTTVLLSIAGLSCGAFLREAKGARTFLAIALYAVPLNFAALGGLVLAADVSGLGAPLLAGSTLLTLGVSALVLSGVAWVGLRALARPHARSLWFALLAGSLLLLAPFRELSFVTPAVGVGLVGAALYQRFLLGSSAALNTLEGWLARVAVVVPVLLLLARTVVYYEGDAAFYVIAFGGVSAFVWVTARRIESRRLRVALDVSTVAFAFFACCFLPTLLRPILGDASADYGLDILQYGCAVVGISFGAVLALMSVSAKQGRRVYANAAGVVAVAGMGVTLFAYEAAVPAALVALLGAASVVAFGYARRSAVSCGAGLLLAVAGTVGLVVGLAELETLSSWPTFAVLGAVAIVTASVIERRGVALKRRMLRVRARFD